MDMTEFGESGQYLRLTNLEQLAAKAQAFDGKLFHPYSTSHVKSMSQIPVLNLKACPRTAPGTKRVWMPDEAEAYIEVEIKELNGDKSTVETKDGRVSRLKASTEP